MTRLNTINQLQKFLGRNRVFWELVGGGYLVVTKPGYQPAGSKADPDHVLTTDTDAVILREALAKLERTGYIQLGRSLRRAL